tara:strand:- start:176 stop:736 length:561 start_codon:yes stop_codon:yes gene_type:complete
MKSTYNNALVYILISKDGKIVYIGSSKQSFKRRLSNHKASYKSYINGNTTALCGSFDIICEKGFTYDILEYYPCKNKKELETRERVWFDKYKKSKHLIVCNRSTMGRTDLERKEYKQQYYLDNEQDKMKLYYKNNIEAFRVYNEMRRNIPKNKVAMVEYHARRNYFRSGWGGAHNNLLEIKLNFFD